MPGIGEADLVLGLEGLSADMQILARGSAKARAARGARKILRSRDMLAAS